MRPTFTSRWGSSPWSAAAVTSRCSASTRSSTPDIVRQLIYRITTTEQQKHLELGRQLDFAYGIRGLARFRVNAYYQREQPRGRVPHDPHR